MGKKRMGMPQPREVDGFRCVATGGSSGGSLSGYQRVARSKGLPEPTKVQGRRGRGRAASLRMDTVTTRRLSDGAELSETIGPAYWSRKRWAAERAAAHLRNVKNLGGVP